MALGCTVAELYRRMSPQEFHDWQAYYYLEPWGHPADELRSARVAAATMAPHVKSVKLSDFMYEPPIWTKPHTSRSLVDRIRAAFGV